MTQMKANVTSRYLSLFLYLTSGSRKIIQFSVGDGKQSSKFIGGTKLKITMFYFQAKQNLKSLKFPNDLINDELYLFKLIMP
jgi:hypothetical protein